MQAPRKIKKKAVRFLRWTEKYTKTDMVYLTKNGFWVSVGYSIEIVAGLIVTVVLANLIPKSVLGTYQFVLSTVLILGAFTLTGINSALLRAVAQGHDGLLWNSIKIKLKWNTGIVITSGIVAIYYFFIGNSVLGTCFLIAGSTAPLIESFGLYQFYLQGKQQFRLNAFIALIRRFLPTLGIVSAAFITTNPVLLILTYYVTNLISITIALRLTLNLDKSFNPVNTNIVTYSKHLSVMNSFGKVANHIDKVLIFNFLGPVAVASFTIAQLPTKYTSNGINLLSSLILPKLATRDFPTLKNTLPRKVLLFFILTSFVVFGYILFAPTVFKIIFPGIINT